MSKFYLKSAEDALKELKSTENGLSGKEASERISRDGKNKLAEKKKVSPVRRFFEQLANPMIIVLLIAAAINLVTVIIDRMQGGDESFAEFIIIVAVVLLNAILGVIQEGKAEQAIEALKEMTASTCKVLRDGNLTAVKNEDLAVGDVVILEAGDSVPADCRLIEAASLKAEESALTGESVPVEKTTEKCVSKDGKDVPLGDRKNMAYMGSTVVYGRGAAVVTATGMNTEMGKIADVLSKTQNEVTPLQKRLNKLSKALSFIVLGICIFIFVFQVILKRDSLGVETILDSFIIAVSLAVAAIPEGLATVVTIVLSMGMTKMAKKKAVVKRLTAVETLGCTQIICSDKTGTLTQNKMTVVESYGGNDELLARAMAQCSDAVLDEETKKAKGEPTECALVDFAYSLKLNKNDFSRTEKRVAEAPFDSMRKMMTTFHVAESGYVQYTKGAPDEILKRCSRVYVDGKEIPLTDEKRAEILAANKDMADRALRVLAAGYKRVKELPAQGFKPEDVECDLTFIGLTGMIDPVRPEVKDAIKLCREAGIRPIMITGDHIDTAVAIAKELGIIENSSQAITGAAMSEIPDEEFEKAIENYGVYARVQPEHKVRIVTTWKKKGYITAMTGDGVNDAPSIKSADIGVGMGITGTDVTKGAADMVLQDDNFATIVTAVGEGRRIYENIRKCIQFLLSSNLAEVIAVFLATMFGFTLMRPMHLLWINLITDTFPALALGMEEGESDLMKRKPRKSDEGIFAGGIGVSVLVHGIFIGLVTLLSYYIGHYLEAGVWDWHFDGSADGMTMAFLTLSMTEVFHSFNARSIEYSIFSIKNQNKFLWGAFALSLVLTAFIIFVPGVNTAFGFASIDFQEYVIAMALAFAIIPFVEIYKIIYRAAVKNKKK